MKLTLAAALRCLICATVLGGCFSSYGSRQITTAPALQEQASEGPIRVLTVDSLLYTLEPFSFTDSMLSGHGTVRHAGGTKSFDGAIPFRRIAFIEGRRSDPWKSAWVIPMMAVAAGGILDILTEPDRFDIHYRSSGSCPFISSFDGAAFRLEGEAFGTSVSKALEAKTFSLLPSLAAVDGRATVRISNDRPETHLLNSGQLLVADAGAASATVLDVANNLWPLASPTPPVSAHDGGGRDILPALRAADTLLWKSDLAATAPLSGFRDRLEAEFELPDGADEATLAVRAVNTELINEVYRAMGVFLGDATLEFYQSLEHDAELQATVRNWIRECGLRIEVLEGGRWIEAAVMPPEANVAPFSRAVRLTNLRGMHGRLRVRLSTLTDVWRIDAVAMDFTEACPLALRPLELLSATASDQRRWESALRSGDSSYVLLLPSRHLDLVFAAPPARSMTRPVYVFAAQGYLYEWFPVPSERAVASGEGVPGSDRVAMLKLLIGQKDLFLPPIYAGWRAARASSEP
jgi:hypothetical protein